MTFESGGTNLMSVSAPVPDRTPSLTERRKAATELEIARAAAALFAERGAQATTAEDIARAAGVAPRTYYRYFRTKQEAVAPLLARGGRRWIRLLAESAENPADRPLAEALVDAAVASFSGGGEGSDEDLDWTLAMLRGTVEDPALRAVWLGVNQDGETELRSVLSELLKRRNGRRPPELELRLAAAAATAAIRVALETWAASPDAPRRGERAPAALVARAMRELTASLRFAP